MRSRLAMLGLLVACGGDDTPQARDASTALLDGGRVELDASRVQDATHDATVAHDAGSAQDASSAHDAASAGGTLDAASPVDAAAVLDDAVTHYDIGWIRGGSDAGITVRADTLIDAPIEKVWQLVRDVNAYHEWCTTLSAETAEVAHGQSIALHIQLLAPPLPPTDSSELIDVVDDARHALSWNRDFGGGEGSIRFQVVEPVGSSVRYTTALLLTPGIGGVTDAFLGPNLEMAFQKIGDELKAAAE